MIEVVYFCEKTTCYYEEERTEKERIVRYYNKRNGLHDKIISTIRVIEELGFRVVDYLIREG